MPLGYAIATCRDDVTGAAAALSRASQVATADQNAQLATELAPCWICAQAPPSPHDEGSCQVLSGPQSESSPPWHVPSISLNAFPPAVAEPTHATQPRATGPLIRHWVPAGHAISEFQRPASPQLLAAPAPSKAHWLCPEAH